MTSREFAALFVDTVKKNGHKAYLADNKNIRVDTCAGCCCPLTYVAFMEKSQYFPVHQFRRASNLFDVCAIETYTIVASADLNTPEPDFSWEIRHKLLEATK